MYTITVGMPTTNETKLVSLV